MNAQIKKRNHLWISAVVVFFGIGAFAGCCPPGQVFNTDLGACMISLEGSWDISETLDAAFPEDPECNSSFDCTATMVTSQSNTEYPAPFLRLVVDRVGSFDLVGPQKTLRWNRSGGLCVSCVELGFEHMPSHRAQATREGGKNDEEQTILVGSAGRSASSHGAGLCGEVACNVRRVQR